MKNRNNPESQPPDKVHSVGTGTTSQPNHNNPAYAVGVQASIEGDYHLYHTVHDQTGEYTYIEPTTSPQRNTDEDVYTYAETPARRNLSLSSNLDAADEGWNDNTIYVATEDASIQNAEEGWADNSVYGN